jgi:hypothetical protein
MKSTQRRILSRVPWAKAGARRGDEMLDARRRGQSRGGGHRETHGLDEGSAIY